jgi:hypothetical protein
MSGDAHKSGQGGDDASQRARLIIALGAAILLAAIVVVVVVARGGDEEPSELLAHTCFETWNDDVVAPRQDGIHAYTAHGYRQTLVTRLDENAEIVGLGDDSTAPGDPQARCAVIFASPQPDEEPDFGVRVYDEGRWTGLGLTDESPLKVIAGLQAEAVADSNALLASNGTLGEG